MNAPLAALCAASLLACSSTSLAETPPAPSDFRLAETLAVDTTLDVHGVNGAIRVDPSMGDALEIVATKSGRDADRVQVVARKEQGATVVCALWPGQDASSCRVGRAPSSPDDDVHARVDIRVRVPAKVRALALDTLNGEVAVDSPAGDVKIRTLNGAVSATTHGALTADALNGAITATVLATSPSAIHLATKNGRVDLTLAETADADVHASTMNGRIASELGAVPPPAIPALHDATFRIGRGGARVDLRTMNGSITIHRRAG